MAFYVYIVASQRNGTIYIGSTDNLPSRIGQHKTGACAGFTKTYGCDKLVWFESFATRAGAFGRERRLKEWRRSWKLMLIEEHNPTWRDLYDGLSG
jgi:putative endonuclease